MIPVKYGVDYDISIPLGSINLFFEKPGKLDEVVVLARDWFVKYLYA